MRKPNLPIARTWQLQGTFNWFQVRQWTSDNDSLFTLPLSPIPWSRFSGTVWYFRHSTACNGRILFTVPGYWANKTSIVGAVKSAREPRSGNRAQRLCKQTNRCRGHATRDATLPTYQTHLNSLACQLPVPANPSALATPCNAACSRNRSTQLPASTWERFVCMLHTLLSSLPLAVMHAHCQSGTAVLSIECWAVCYRSRDWVMHGHGLPSPSRRVVCRALSCSMYLSVSLYSICWARSSCGWAVLPSRTATRLRRRRHTSHIHIDEGCWLTRF